MLRYLHKETEHDRIINRQKSLSRLQRTVEEKRLEQRKVRMIEACIMESDKPVYPLPGRKTLMDCFTIMDGELLLWFDDHQKSTGAFRERWINNN